LIALLDVNVLIALAWPNHVYHDSARKWFQEQKKYGWATCPTTENGFIRISSNTKITPEAKSPGEAAHLLRALIAIKRHVFWPEEGSILDDRWISLKSIHTYRQVTDAHLLSLAIRHKGFLATFDRGISGLLSEREKAKKYVSLIMRSIG
jgi:uncharacterized protein